MTQPLATMIKEMFETRQEVADTETEALRLRAELKTREGLIAEQMAINGIDRISVDGKTVYRLLKRFVSKRAGVDSGEACTYLEGIGLDYLVKPGYHPSSLKSYVVELLNSKENLPEGFNTLFSVLEEPSVGVRSS